MSAKIFGCLTRTTRCMRPCQPRVCSHGQFRATRWDDADTEPAGDRLHKGPQAAGATAAHLMRSGEGRPALAPASRPQNPVLGLWVMPCGRRAIRHVSPYRLRLASGVQCGRHFSGFSYLCWPGHGGLTRSAARRVCSSRQQRSGVTAKPIARVERLFAARRCPTCRCAVGGCLAASWPFTLDPNR